MIDDPEIDVERLRARQGSDFPTGGSSSGTPGIRDCYLTGRGRDPHPRARPGRGGRGGTNAMVVTEIPFQVNKAALLEKIADLVRDGKVSATSVRDESGPLGRRACAS